MSLIRRQLRYLLVVLLGLAVAGVATLTLLSATETGSRWLLQQIQPLVPGELAIERIEGTLLGGLALGGIDYALDGDRLHIGHLEIRWRPAGLLSATLQVEALSIRDASYQTPAGATGPDITLPERIVLPLAITLEAVRISGLQIAYGAERLQFDTIELAARAGPLTGLSLERLDIRSGHHVLAVRGAAALQRSYPFHAVLHWSSVLPDGVPLGGEGRLEGDRRLITLSHRLRMAPAQLETQGTLRLDTAVPEFALSGHWQALQWPLTGTAAYLSREGEYTLQGVPDAYRFTLNGQLAGSGLPPLALRAQGAGNRQRLALEPLTLTALGGRLDATGSAAWSPEPALELALQASDLNPAGQWSEWPGRLGGTARLHARPGGEQARFALEDIDLHGQLRDYPLQVRGGLTFAGTRFAAHALQVRSGANRITLSGALNEPTGLEVRVRAPELPALWPGLGGRLEADGRLQGTLAQPAGHGRLKAGGLSYRDYALDTVTAAFALDAQRLEDSSAELHATGVRIAAAPLAELSLHARGWQAAHRVELEATTGAGSAQLELDGHYRDARWEGELGRATFDLHSLGTWRLQRPLPVTATATTLEPLSGCWSAGAAEACAQADWKADSGWRAGAQLNALPLQPLLALWEIPVTIQGGLDAELSAAGSAQGLEARLAARAGPGEITLRVPDQPPYRSRYHELRLTASYADETARLEATARFEEGTAQGRLALAGLGGTAPAIDGMADVDLPDIRFIDGLLPGLAVSGGVVRLQARVGGRLDAPRVNGSAALEQGSVQLPALGLTLHAIQLRAEGRDRRVTLSGALTSGDGNLALAGDLDLDPGASWPFELALRGKDIQVVQRPDMEISASPDLALRGSLARVDISGRVQIPRARIRVRELPAGVVRVSEDQVIVGAPQRGEGAPMSRIPVTVNVLVTLGEDVRFEGLGLSTGLRGEVNVRSRQGAGLAGNGILVFEKGRYAGYGQQLNIEEGRLLFTGPLDNPDLDIRATRSVGQVVAGIALSGSLDAPETRLFSDPAMPDAEILSYIVTGKPLDSASGGKDSQALASAAASLGANSPVAGEISRKLGIDIGTKSGATEEETAVTVGKQITPRLYVDYLYGLFNEVATLQFTYKLSDYFSLLGESGTAQAIDLRFNIERD